MNRIYFGAAGVVLALAVSWLIVDARKLSLKKKELESAWNTVLIETGRREVLIPNLIRLVQGSARKESLKELDAVRTSLSIKGQKPTLDTLDERSFRDFIESQRLVQEGLGRLISIAEPMKKVQKDRDFQIFSAQLKSLNARVISAEFRYSSSAKIMNEHLSSFPGLISKIFVNARPMPEN